MYRLFISTLVILLFVSSKPHDCDCEKNLPAIKDAFDKADFVAVGVMAEHEGKYYFDINTALYKGNQYLGIFETKEGPCDISYEDGKTYLIYGMYSKDGSYASSTNRCTRTREITNLEDEELRVLSAMAACQDTSIAMKGPVMRNFNPVCGCNGKDYGNYDEARHNGLRMWKKGSCKQ